MYITKRQLGFGFLAAGILAALGILAVDWFEAGRFGGIGPLQQLGLIGAGLLFLIGLSLLPLGNRPA